MVGEQLCVPILSVPVLFAMCPACHEKDERAAQSKPMPYFLELMYLKAFKHTVEGNILPVCDKPTFIRGVCERASKSQVCAGPILILHFIYVGMNSRGSLPRVLNTALEEYHTASMLCYHEVVFDFGTWDKLCLWETKAQALATEIGKDKFKYKVVFVSVHSEVTRGDLFAGKDENGEDVAVEPMESKEGDNPASLSSFVAPPGLHLTDIRLKPTYTVAFGVDRFISTVLKSFIVAFGVRVLIQGHALCEVITDLLNVSLELRMHSDTFFFQLKEQTAPGLPLPSPNPPSVIGVCYSWYHNHRRPWGTALPMSCPKCSSIIARTKVATFEGGVDGYTSVGSNIINSGSAAANLTPDCIK
ncbi:hypothetical protein EDD15DRAFT_2193722 [Pisolithus albus]|nr:hypothetical protein EDD15DRAFT_2193722 [Pisolithus albus]